jgi:spore coat protein CotH
MTCRSERRPRRAEAAAGVVFALIVAACADSGSGPPGGTGTTAAVATLPDSSGPPTPTSATTEAAATTEADFRRWQVEGADVLFDQEAFHTFEIDLSPADLAFLDADPAAEEYVEGSLTFDGETIEGIGVRYKGSVGAFVGCTAGPNPFAASGPKTCTKLSMQLKINTDDRDREFYGVRRVQLHAQNLDPSMMHERLGYWLFREMGVAAPRSTHARVVVNGEYLGVFALTEEIDGRFTRANFDDGAGNLYKEVWPFAADGTAQPAEVFVDALVTNEDDGSRAELMMRFTEEFLAAPPGERTPVLERWFDLDTLIATFVVDRAIRHDDGPLHWYCFDECEPHNFYLYEDPTAEQLTLVPWDLDNAFDALVPGTAVGNFVAIADPFGEITADCAPFPFGSFGLLQRSAACDPLVAAVASLTDHYERIRAELLAGPFAEERITEELDRWTAQIEPAVREAAAAHDDAPSVDEWLAAVERLVVGLETSRVGSGR